MYFLSKTINSRIQCRVICIQNAIKFFSTFYYVIYVDTEKQRSNNGPLWNAGFSYITLMTEHRLSVHIAFD